MRRLLPPLAGALALAAAALVGGCDSSVDDPFEEQTVVTAILIANEPLPAITLTKTVPFLDFYAPQYVAGATMTVELVGADGTPEARYPYVQSPDGPYVPAVPAPVLGGRRYRLEVVVPGNPEAITAETVIPTGFQVGTPLPDPVTYQEGDGPELRVTQSQFPGRQSIYLFTIKPLDPQEYERAEDTSTEEAGDSVWVAVPGTGYEPVPLVADLIFDRDVDPESFIVGNSPLINAGSYTPDGAGTLGIRVPWLAVYYYGPLEVTLTAVDDALVDFFQSQAIQTIPPTISPGEIPNVVSNVQNGVGVFGGVARVRDTTFVQPEAGRPAPARLGRR